MERFIHTGVYGDHSTDGWLEWGLNHSFARKRAQEEYTPASNELALVDGWIANGRMDRANELIQKAGALAAVEARLRWGIEIKGWRDEWAEQKYKSFYDSYAQDFAAAMAAEEACAQGIEINGDFSEPGIRTW